MMKRLILENDESQLVLMAGFLAEAGMEFGLEEKKVQALHLVLEEAVSNVMFYAYPEESGRRIEVEIGRDGDEVWVVVRDEGIAFDPMRREDPDVGLAAEDREIGGLGIFLIRRLMDEVEYERVKGWNVLRMRMKV